MKPTVKKTTSVDKLSRSLQQREAELALINSVQQGLAAEVHMQGIYDMVGDHIRDLFDAQSVSIGTFDQEAAVERFQYNYEDGERFYPKPRPLDNFRKKLIKEKELILINEKLPQEVAKIEGKAAEAVPGTELPKAVLFVPMIVGDSVRGYVSLQNLDREHAFSDSDVRLLGTLTNSMSVALENARLFNETEQRNAELAVINSVQQGLVAEMDMQGIYDLVGEKIRDLFDAQVTGIYSFDLDTNLEHFQYLFEDGERLYPDPRPLNSLRNWIITNRSLLWINEDVDDKVMEITGEKNVAVPGTRLPKSLLFVPLMVGENVKGCVSLQNLDREHAFSDSDVRLLSTLANSMSVALENARLFNETEQRNAELAVINSVQHGLVAEMDMQGIYDLVGNRIQGLFDAQVVGINTIDLEQEMEYFKYAYEEGEVIDLDPLPLDTLRKKLITDKKMIWIGENIAEEWEKITGERPKAVPGTRLAQTVLYVPMMVGDTVRGYVTLQNLDHENAFTESDVRLLNTLVNSMSVALENARLFNETEQRNAELAVINSIQQGLVAEMDMQGIYDLVGDRIRDLFDAQVAAISTFDHENKTEKFQYLFEDGKRFYPDPRSYDKMREFLIVNKELLLINKNAAQKFEEITGEAQTVVPGTKLPKSLLFVPLIIGDSVNGYVTLQNIDHENAFSDSDARLLKTLTNSMSVALENARLFNETTRLLAETEQRNAELAVINSVQEGLVREMDMQAIYNLVGDRICDVLNTQSLLIRTFDHKKGLENWEYVIENGKRLYSEPRPFIWANKRLIESKESLVINEDYLKTAQKFGGKGVTKGMPPKSAIFIPMVVGNEVIGSVSSQNVEEEHAFNESDVRLLTTLTNSMSVALENARLFNETTRLLTETEQRATELDTVNRISKALVSQLEFDALVKLVGEQMRETFKADIVYLAMHEKETNMLHFPYIYGEDVESRPFGNGLTEKIITSREPLLVNTNMDEAYDKLQADRKGIFMQSFLGVPIIIGKNAIGVISVQSTEQENRFDEYDQRLLSTIAANVGIAMQNAEAYQNLQAALTELETAQEQLVQQEKLASLGQLTAGIAHEIKNPLNFVNNFSDVSIELLEEVREELSDAGNQPSEAFAILDDIEANLRKIYEHGTRADSIVKSMLQHSRGGTGKVEPTNLNAVVKEYVNLSFHGMRAGKDPINVDIQFDFDNSIGTVPLVAEDFSRVIVNLCNNGFDAMREKLSTAGDQPPAYKPKLTLRTKKTNGNAVVEIEDNGPGIPVEFKDKILQPFFTTKKGTDGTGLGLSITNDIVKAHKGFINIESQPGASSTFIITLPIKPD